jgi:hypothetical protein
MAVAPGDGMSLFSINEVSAPLRQTLAACVPDLHRYCRDRWVVIGSAATWLAGHTLSVGDLDVLTSTRDAQALIQHWHESRLSTGHAAGAEQFRSHFARFAFPGVPVEIMGDLEAHDGRDWCRVRVGHIVIACLGDLEIPIPSEDEQIRLLRLFGRDKDLQRAAWLAGRENQA